MCTRVASAKMDASERDLGGGWTRVSPLTFLNFPVSGDVLSSVFLTRTSCGKITHENNYYGAWARWAVSVSVLPE